MAEPGLDVAIFGAGPVGCSLALALRGSGLRVAIVERAREPMQDEPQATRPVALSYASRLILERIGAWEGLATTPIERIHVSQAGAFGRTRIACAELGLPALGYVAGYDAIAAHLARHARESVRREDESAAASARLVVHAEGSAGPDAAGKDYGHSAIVTVVESELPASSTAWERFTREGPLALLPLGKAYGVVWSRTSAAATASMQANDAQFLEELQAAFGLRAGRFHSVGPRAAAPLALRYTSGPPPAGELRIGNAAQSLHPVAGQGLNLGLRDAWTLARLLREAPPVAAGSPGLAMKFLRARRLDVRATIRATDLLATLYVRRDPLASALRGAALTALDVFPPARKAFARRMIYGASAW